MSKRVYAGAAALFDERRNSSRVFPPPPGSGAQFARFMARRTDEPWYRWVLARRLGHHLHGEERADGSRAACPLRGCDG